MGGFFVYNGCIYLSKQICLTVLNNNTSISAIYRATQQIVHRRMVVEWKSDILYCVRSILLPNGIDGSYVAFRQYSERCASTLWVVKPTDEDIARAHRCRNRIWRSDGGWQFACCTHCYLVCSTPCFGFTCLAEVGSGNFLIAFNRAVVAVEERVYVPAPCTLAIQCACYRGYNRPTTCSRTWYWS